HDPRFKDIRKEVIGFLLGQGGRAKAAVTRKLVLPDIEPEDLNVPRGLGAAHARRKHEEKRETVEVS
ncbi:MAG TPA: ABC transporter ATP-binding protein, partial [Verrucomicrobiae bacterium]|nr:ABC transporter ATP-binding protein [Verrucomicrobiae bacterium]